MDRDNVQPELHECREADVERIDRLAESTEHVTVVPAEMYDEMMSDDPGVVNENLGDAFRRARSILNRTGR